MSWRIAGAINEAEAHAAMLEQAGLFEAARLSRARCDGLTAARAFAEADLDDAIAEAEAEAAPAEAEPAPAVARYRQKLLTPAREALFRNIWPDTRISIQDIAEQLMTIEGPPIPYPKSVNNFARRLGLPTSRVDAAILAADVSSEDLAEARAMLTASQGGPDTLSQYFGWAPHLSAAIAAKLRAERATVARIEGGEHREAPHA